MQEALKRAMAEFGTSQEFADALDVAQSTPFMWLERKKIPPLMRPAIERVTKGKVACEELGDDAKWIRVRDKAWPHKSGRPLLDATPEPAKA